MLSQVFPCDFLQIYITSVSECLLFTFKTCQIVAGASMNLSTSRVFQILFLAGFCNLVQLCVAAGCLLRVLTARVWQLLALNSQLNGPRVLSSPGLGGREAEASLPPCHRHGCSSTNNRGERQYRVLRNFGVFSCFSNTYISSTIEICK